MSEKAVEHLDYATPDPAADGLGRSWRLDTWALLILALPNVASTLAQTLMSVTDFFIVSRMPNATDAQAAVSSAGMIFITLFAMPMGTMTCVTTMVSQSLGAGRHRDCAAYAWQGIWVTTGFGLLAILLWPVAPGLYALIGHDPAVQRMEVDYTQIRLLSLGLAGATVALDNFFNGIHRPAINTVSVVAATLLNAALTYAWVLGKWGFPAMGVVGAAWATLVATAFRAAWMMTALCFGRTARQYKPLQACGFDGLKMWRLIKVGWPSGMSFLMDIGAWAVFLTAIIGRFGTIDLAATAVVWRYLEMSFMPAVGIGIAVSTAVGKAIGQDRPSLARRMAWIGTGINAAYMSGMALLFITSGGLLMRVFSSDSAVIELGVRLFFYAAIFQFFDAFAITHSCALRGAGDTFWPSFVAAVEVWTILIGGSALIVRLRPDLGSGGPWIFAAVFVIAVGITFFLRWRWGPWEKLDVIGRKEKSPLWQPETGPAESVLAQGAAATEWNSRNDPNP